MEVPIRSSARRGGADHEAVPHVGGEDAVEGLVDPPGRDDLDEVEGAGIEHAEELRIASRRPDGWLSDWRTIWVVRSGDDIYVRSGDDIYVRSVNGRSSVRYQGTRARQEGSVRVGGVAQEVDFVDAVTDELDDQVDAAYRAKYGHYATSIIRAVTGPEANATAMRFVPRPAGS